MIHFAVVLHRVAHLHRHNILHLQIRDESVGQVADDTTAKFANNFLSYTVHSTHCVQHTVATNFKWHDREFRLIEIRFGKRAQTTKRNEEQNNLENLCLSGEKLPLEC